MAGMRVRVRVMAGMRVGVRYTFTLFIQIKMLDVSVTSSFTVLLNNRLISSPSLEACSY
jgi:hypothetical protein